MAKTTEKTLRENLVRVCRMLHHKNLIAAMDGNVSVKCGDGLLTTPSGVNKGFLEEDHLILVDWNGRVVEGGGQPTSEMAMHLAVYRLRPEVEAVVHAHPPVATAFSIAGISLEDFVLPEVVMTMGVIPTVSYATPTTAEVPESIRTLVLKHDALILERHGALTVGRDLMEAYNKMEKLEHAALIIFSALQLGRVKRLPPREVEKLLHLKIIQKLQSS
ncbi:MAG: class II aldolase/adducin family protein [Deltaproteobacteria bacterium]|nr:class II aldolase/adducin family protein [Deltaproteobacteria bacterium]